MIERTPHPLRREREGTKGQVMVIFAFVAVVLFVIAGLSVDAGLSYLKSDATERAAAAGALAGVAYLPSDYTDALNAALVETSRDGFTNNASNTCTTSSCNSCTTTSPMPCIDVTQPTTNELKVTVFTTVQTTFLRLLGFGAHAVQRSETAIYLPPIALGQPGSQQGSEMDSPCDGVPTTSSSGSNDGYCNPPSNGLGSGGNNFYFLRTEGWGAERSEGDAFTPSSDDPGTVCSPQSNCIASPADVHAISPEEVTETQVTTPIALNYNGGYNYLVAIPPGQSADLQIYNPAFAPGSNDDTSSIYTYHESDADFTASTTSASSYAAMVYSLFQVTTLSSNLNQTLVSQEMFYPYNASGLYEPSSPSAMSYQYYKPTGSGTSMTTVTGKLPATYHQWVSALQYQPSSSNGADSTLFDSGLRYGSSSGGSANGTYLSNTGSTTEYFRFEVDTLTWNGQPTCSSSSCTVPSTPSTSYPEAHKGYALRLVSDTGGTLGTSQCNSTCGTISALDDMTVYTPIDGANATQFCIPLFKLDPAYSGQTININIFDPGDVGGGAAYMGLELPSTLQDSAPTTFCTNSSVQFATANSMTNLGTSLGAGGTATVSSLGTWPGSGGQSCNACFQTASSSGGAIYNGQWIHLQMTVPSGFDSSDYFELAYDVNSSATAGDTFSIQVGYNGTPDHLLP